MYCHYWSKKLQTNSKIECSDEVCEIVAKLTDGFSFAYMKELFVQALLAIMSGHADVEEDEVDAAVVEKAAEETKVVTDSTKLAQDGASTGADGEDKAAGEKVKATGKPECKVPTVDIPEHLKSNSFLRIMQKQAVALVKDMDNTSDESGSKPEVS